MEKRAVGSGSIRFAKLCDFDCVVLQADMVQPPYTDSKIRERTLECQRLDLNPDSHPPISISKSTYLKAMCIYV